MRLHHSLLTKLATVPVAMAMTIAVHAQTPQSNPTDKEHPAGHSATQARAESSGEGQVMVSEADSKFLREAAEGGMMEVQAARMAQEKATSENVKAFAKELEQDHSKANEELKQLATEKKIDLPADLGEKHQKHMTKLEKASGAEFDREYMKLMVDDHKKDVKAFKKQADRAMDSEVKAFAADKVPVLEQHLSQAQQLNDEVRGSGTRTRSADPTTYEQQLPQQRLPQTRPDDPTNPTNRPIQPPQGQNNPTIQP